MWFCYGFKSEKAKGCEGRENCGSGGGRLRLNPSLVGSKPQPFQGEEEGEVEGESD